MSEPGRHASGAAGVGDEAARALTEDGALARAVPGFDPRAQQQSMARAVGEALAADETLVVEAGTGTGKTFAYLVPTLLAGRKTLVSTGTRHLQDQLFRRDLPQVQRALGVPLRTALLKGRANYLCWYRLELAEQAGAARDGDVATVRAWAGGTRTGDVAEVAGVAEDSPVWPRVTSTTDNCLGQECPYYSDCFVVRARRAAQEADLVVINHHLLCADLALKEDGFGELLPSAEAFVLDEAHQLPEIAARFFGESLSARQLLDLARDAMDEHAQEAGDMPGLVESARDVEQATAALRLAMGEPVRRVPWESFADDAGVRSAVERLDGALAALVGELAQAAPRGRGLESCHRRAEAARERLGRLAGERDAPGPRENDAEEDGDEPGAVRWLETTPRGFTLNLTPLDVGPTFRARRQEYPCAWIFTSATLAVGGRFDHFNERLGLDAPRMCLLDSPFDFARNALLYMPDGLPDPSDDAYTEAVVDAAAPVIEAARGRSFLLFTSHRALRRAQTLLAGRLEYPLFVQGTAPRGELLERFRASGHGVLLGTTSFWEGVDVPGPALTCVVIDRLPFAAPGDPLLQARLSALRARGRNPFPEYQLPQAVIMLKQGVGRLIRGPDDRGVMMLCDPRLRSRGYGRVFLDSLPPMRRVGDLDTVRAFLLEAGN